MSETEEYSESGAPIYRYEPRQRGFEAASGDSELIEQIEEHIQHYVGSVSSVFHEVVSDLVHIDVHLVAPTPERDYATLVTSGMSARPMKPPDGLEECRYAELMLCLPPDWPLTANTEFEDEAIYWPIRWLKTLARFPHEYQTWLFWGHTIPNGDPPQPFAPGTQLSSMLLLEPSLPRPGFSRLELDPDRIVHFFALVPLHQEEMEFKLKQGAEALEERLRSAGVTELLDTTRPSVI